MKRLLALFAVASIALPVQAQFNPLPPAEIPDTVYYEGEILVGDPGSDHQPSARGFV